MDRLRRLNHWVPAAYLAAFTDTATPNGLLTIRDRKEPSKILRLPPDAIAKERNLYVVANPPEEYLGDEIERFLAEHIEAPFIPVRDILVYGNRVGFTGVLNRDQLRALSYFLAFQQIRTPAFRARVNLLLEFQGAMVAHTLFSNPSEVDRIHRNMKGGPAPAGQAKKLLRALENQDIVVRPSEKGWLKMALELAVEMRPMIESLPRRVFRAPDDLPLFTSDSPVVLVDRASADEYSHSGGWQQPTTEATLALSPNTVLVIGGALVNYSDQGSRKWFEQLRHRTATTAERWIFMRDDDPQAAKWLYSSKSPEFVVAFPGGKFEAGESAMAAVLQMKRQNPGEAVIRFGPKH